MLKSEKIHSRLQWSLLLMIKIDIIFHYFILTLMTQAQDDY